METIMMQSTNAKIIRLREVMNRTGLSRSTIYSLMSRGDFPKNIRIGSNSVGWLESEIEEWIQARMAERYRANSTTQQPIVAQV